MLGVEKHSSTSGGWIDGKPRAVEKLQHHLQADVWIIKVCFYPNPCSISFCVDIVPHTECLIVHFSAFLMKICFISETK